jgi:hypothetical protein
MTAIQLEHADVSSDPFPHLVAYPALPEELYRELHAAVPEPGAFDLRGKGRKLELDIAESAPAFARLDPARQQRLIALRTLLRETAPMLAARFREALDEKYAWLLGHTLARQVLSAGWTTTNGRVMGRAPGYQLDPHLDSAHVGMTCLMYFSDALRPEDGALGLFRPDTTPEVRTASTYYPHKEEGIASRLVRSIPIRQNLFVSFVAGPVSLHGFGRSASEATGWRFVYQCHIMPKGLDMTALAPRMPEAQRSRWAKYLTAEQM